MDPVISFGRILRRLRKQAGLSQEKLAFKAEIERNFVSLIERGINQPTIRVIFKLSAALQTTPSILFSLVEEDMKNGRYRGSDG